MTPEEQKGHRLICVRPWVACSLWDASCPAVCCPWEPTGRSKPLQPHPRPSGRQLSLCPS